MEAKINVITYEQSRLEYFTNLLKYAQKTYNRLFKKFKDAHYISAGAQALSDAEAEIQFLGDVVEMLEKGNCNQEWISVEDRLPELYKYVITYDMSLGVSIDSVLSNGEFVLGRRVTHWMPLPEPPKMKGESNERQTD